MQQSRADEPGRQARDCAKQGKPATRTEQANDPTRNPSGQATRCKHENESCPPHGANGLTPANRKELERKENGSPTCYAPHACGYVSKDAQPGSRLPKDAQPESRLPLPLLALHSWRSTAAAVSDLVIVLTPAIGTLSHGRWSVLTNELSGGGPVSNKHKQDAPTAIR
jgi:hypothetical protein